MNKVAYIAGYTQLLLDLGLYKEAGIGDFISRLGGGAGALRQRAQGVLGKVQNKAKGLLNRPPSPPSNVQKPMTAPPGHIPKPANQVGPAERSAAVFEDAIRKNNGGNPYSFSRSGKALIAGGLGAAGLAGGLGIYNSRKQQEAVPNEVAPMSVDSPLNAYYAYNNSLNSYYGPQEAGL